MVRDWLSVTAILVEVAVLVLEVAGTDWVTPIGVACCGSPTLVTGGTVLVATAALTEGVVTGNDTVVLWGGVVATLLVACRTLCMAGRGRVLGTDIHLGADMGVHEGTEDTAQGVLVVPTLAAVAGELAAIGCRPLVATLPLLPRFATISLVFCNELSREASGDSFPSFCVVLPRGVTVGMALVADIMGVLWEMDRL